VAKIVWRVGNWAARSWRKKTFFDKTLRFYRQYQKIIRVSVLASFQPSFVLLCFVRFSSFAVLLCFFICFLLPVPLLLFLRVQNQSTLNQ
jgi:hypothetical protein